MTDTSSERLRFDSALQRRHDDEIIYLVGAMRQAVQKRLLDGELKDIVLNPIIPVDEVLRLLDEKHGANPKWVTVLMCEELEQLRKGSPLNRMMT